MAGKEVLLIFLALAVGFIIMMVRNHRKLLAEVKSVIACDKPSPKGARWKTGASLRSNIEMETFKND